MSLKPSSLWRQDHPPATEKSKKKKIISEELRKLLIIENEETSLEEDSDEGENEADLEPYFEIEDFDD